MADNILLIGDFNAYGQEDPVRLLTGGKTMKQPVQTSTKTTINCREVPAEQVERGFGLVNLAPSKYSYSFTYDGELGALDHALANKALAGKVCECARVAY